RRPEEQGRKGRGGVSGASTSGSELCPEAGKHAEAGCAIALNDFIFLIEQVFASQIELRVFVRLVGDFRVEKNVVIQRRPRAVDITVHRIESDFRRCSDLPAFGRTDGGTE